MSVDEEKRAPKFHETFVFKVGFVAVLLIGLYYLMSPYQVCKRETSFSLRQCVAQTNW